MGCDTAEWRHRLAVAACPRPQQPIGVAPQFADQQNEIRELRQRGFRNDFFAQLELARRYEGQRTQDKNLEDPVEAAVWYGMALANNAGYETLGARYASRKLGGRIRFITHFDDCRAFERGEAYASLNRLLSRMATDEQEKVRDRITYILSTQGADGYRTLARLHDASFGPFGEPVDNPQALYAIGRPDRPGAPAVLQLFSRNDVDSYLYNSLAAQTGDVGAYVMLKDFERSSPERAQYASFVQSKVDRWVPPYEFYPPEAPNSGVPHTDESEPQGEAAEAALARISELPFAHIADALLFLRVIPSPCPGEAFLPPKAAETFQAMIGRPLTGRLSPLERVRVIQMAAVDGSPHAQLVLAVMYAEGVGVPRDTARAFAWFERAAKQGNPEAKYAMSQFFSLGVEGVSDQDKAKAVVYQIDAALAGFRPSADHLQEILARMSHAPYPRRQGGYW